MVFCSTLMTSFIKSPALELYKYTCCHSPAVAWHWQTSNSSNGRNGTVNDRPLVIFRDGCGCVVRVSLCNAVFGGPGYAVAARVVAGDHSALLRARGLRDLPRERACLQEQKGERGSFAMLPFCSI